MQCRSASSTESQAMVGFLEPTTRLMSTVSSVPVLRLTVLGSKAVRHGANAGVGIGGKVDSSKMTGEGNERSDQTRVLVGVS